MLIVLLLALILLVGYHLAFAVDITQSMIAKGQPISLVYSLLLRVLPTKKRWWKVS
ncbi:MAG: amino acid transporter [Paraglaciecola sp.]|jgi:amino acid transporter